MHENSRWILSNMQHAGDGEEEEKEEEEEEEEDLPIPLPGLDRYVRATLL